MSALMPAEHLEMSGPAQAMDRSSPRAWQLAMLSLAVVLLAHTLEGNVLFDGADEGLLWYGTVHTAKGEVPVRDFRSYQPGRYYWGALWVPVLGDGILALRLSTVLFFGVGLFCGLLVLRRLHRSWAVMVFAACLIAMWMFPRHKLFEPAISLIAVYTAVRLLEEPSSRMAFAAGVFVGIAGVFGQNLGLYTSLAFFCLIALLLWRVGVACLGRTLAIWLAGIVTGFSPVLLMMLFVPGFGAALLESVLFWFRQGKTNLPIPIPWPWRADYAAAANSFEILSKASLGTFFLLCYGYYLWAILKILRSKSGSIKEQPVLAAVAFTGAFFMHHASVRASLGHLAQSIHPFLLGCLTLPHFCTRPRPRGHLAVLCLLVGGLSFLATVPGHPLYRQFLAARAGAPLVATALGQDRVLLDRASAAGVLRVTAMVARCVPANEGMFVGPVHPGLYVLLNRSSPLHETYILWPPVSPEAELDMIRSLDEKHINYVLLADFVPEGREELRFCNTHKRLFRHLDAAFDPLRPPELPSGWSFLRRGHLRSKFDKSAQVCLTLRFPEDTTKVLAFRDTVVKQLPSHCSIRASGVAPSVALPPFKLPLGKAAVLRVALTSPADSVVQVLYLVPGEPAYSDAQSVTRHVSEGHSVVFLELPPCGLTGPLRLALGSLADEYAIHSIEIRAVEP